MYLYDCSFLSPGLSADAEVDDLIKKTCEDADVFVYVCDGTKTLEEPVCRSCYCPILVYKSMLYAIIL